MAIRNGFDNEFNTCYVTFPRKCSTTIVDYLRALTSDCADPKITIALDLLHIRKRNRQFNHSFFDSRGSTLVQHSLALLDIQLLEAPSIDASTASPTTTPPMLRLPKNSRHLKYPPDPLTLLNKSVTPFLYCYSRILSLTGFTFPLTSAHVLTYRAKNQCVRSGRLVVEDLVRVTG
ncbi:hypothetical protein GCK72_020529 [Caenorhabditis remanei]|uniref:Uncharacterized protein n=1 Tax=Caenorhabditis remanei TaxID=31234 RepID=A0A6A5GHJ0_CAERE|nr:hypothetical protein GCK72_020529 [Caenorhabditis remanei]KAF1753972.1 hypothetical protein GCK72_020529 [Caenorhabditis remanei]